MQTVSSEVDSEPTDEHGSAVSSVKITGFRPTVTIDFTEHAF
jgi:hypothetical protein